MGWTGSRSARVIADPSLGLVSARLVAGSRRSPEPTRGLAALGGRPLRPPLALAALAESSARRPRLAAAVWRRARCCRRRCAPRRDGRRPPRRDRPPAASASATASTSPCAPSARPSAPGRLRLVRRGRGRSRPAARARLLARAARWSPFPRSLAIGDELALSGLRGLRPGTAPASGGSRDPPFDYDAYLRRRGVAAELLLDRVRPTGRRRGGLAGASTACASAPSAPWSPACPPDRAALLRGMVLGEDERIDAGPATTGATRGSLTCSRSAART